MSRELGSHGRQCHPAGGTLELDQNPDSLEHGAAVIPVGEAPGSEAQRRAEVPGRRVSQPCEQEPGQ